MSETIKIGVSACVAGERVRWDRSHRRSAYLAETLSKYVELVPICPEIACGMGIPREQLRQADCAGDIRLIGYDSGEDFTEKMSEWADRVLPGLDEEEICGFVLRQRSPSCAKNKSKIYSTTGKPHKHGPGFFTRKLTEHAPLLPMVTSEELQNPLLRDNFIRRVFVLNRWRTLLGKGKRIGQLVDFHTRHKMLIRAHDLRGYRELGRLLGESTMQNVDEVFATYASLLFKSLALKTTARKNSDVLQHAMGFFKKDLDDGDKRELLAMITNYANGKLPLLMPVTLLNHYARKYHKPYLAQQYYLNPEPAELKLLYHA
ncbi:YbgA family protein [Pseudodesulfovibrio indicus]|uniref:Uncharacterized protein YbgA (DUF1722 family) n=1 Tax=Pseudodesulfovibrio indicus TaxID=1716143 RepID=A0A126QPE5_9BACT|nr:DUF523 and DUF1722 domain-containing protein [Pseudodesulfovibrio indicus]AMK11325.1 hypothetical protein AWY79_09460 [Pseudodesulfovibrio indicus]TDT89710.1 uncharacterized protein YbgA (DUF1722 family) [Pseudodesulfovibrio indicus]